MLQHSLVPCETAADLAHIVCTPHNHAPVYNVILFEATCVGCMCVSVACQLCFWTEWPAFLHCYCGNTGVEWFCVEVFYVLYMNFIHSFIHSFISDLFIHMIWAYFVRLNFQQIKIDPKL